MAETPHDTALDQRESAEALDAAWDRAATHPLWLRWFAGRREYLRLVNTHTAAEPLHIVTAPTPSPSTRSVHGD